MRRRSAKDVAKAGLLRIRSGVLRARQRLGERLLDLDETAVLSQLRTTGDVSGLCREALEYNRARSAEARNLICDSNRVLLFRYALDTVARCREGDYADVGTYRGMTASLIWKRLADGCDLHCFDTFEGFDDDDLRQEESLDRRSEAARFTDTSLEHVAQAVTGGQEGHPRLKLHKGHFPETFSGLEPKRFRFVHLDMDLEKPIRDGLEVFWPRLVPGGVLLVHDYLSPQYPGVKKAVDEYFQSVGTVVLPWCDRLGTAVAVRSAG